MPKTGRNLKMIPTAGNKRWEIKISQDDYDRFTNLLYIMDGKLTASHATGGKRWIVCHTSEEFRVMAKLSFDVEEMGMGIDIQL